MAIVKAEAKKVVPQEIEASFNRALEAQHLEQQFSALKDAEKRALRDLIDASESFTLRVGQTVEFAKGLLITYERKSKKVVDADSLIDRFVAGEVPREVLVAAIKEFDTDFVSKLDPTLVSQTVDENAPITWAIRAHVPTKAEFAARFAQVRDKAVSLLAPAPPPPVKKTKRQISVEATA